MRINDMKRILILGAAALAAACACTQEETGVDGAQAKAYLEAWIAINHPEAVLTNGIYMLEDVPGTGEAFHPGKDSSYVFANYTIRALDGTVTANNHEQMDKQLGKYDPSNWYGPTVNVAGKGCSYAGVDRLLDGMTPGGRRTAVIPAWLLTNSRYGTEQEYLDHLESSSVSAVYTITYHGHTKDILSYKGTELDNYAKKHLHGADSTYLAGSTDQHRFGFYFDSLEKPSDEVLPNDTTVYIDYIGRLLNGQVFDTTVADTAKVYGIWSSSKTYEPVAVKMAETFTNITLSGSTTITGFSAGMKMMHPGEKASFAFYYALGYGATGSGTRIPGYASLQFDVALVDKPE